MAASSLRIASVGYAFHDPRVSDVVFRSSLTLLGSDVVLLRLQSLQWAYSPDYGQRLYQGALSVDDDDSVRIDADVERRRAEIKGLLAAGATIVLYLPPPEHWYVDTGERRYSGTGKNRQATRMVSRRELFSVLPFSISSVAAESRDLEVVGGGPVATFWRAIDGAMSAAAYLDSEFGAPTLRIRGSAAVVGSIAKIESGIVIVLPQDILYSDLEALEEASARGEPYSENVLHLDALLALVREVRAGEGEYSQPEWSKQFLLAGEEAELDAVAKAEKRSERALAAVDKASAKLTKIQRRKTLITGTGKAFETVMAEGFEALGFQVEEGAPNRTDRVVRHPDHGPAVIEAKGKGTSAAEKDSAQLEKWVSEHRLAHGEKAKAILVVNAWRDAALDQRTKPAFPDQMLEYAEAREHCLLTGAQLLCAWLDAEAHPEERSNIATALFDCRGRFDKYDDWSEFIRRSEIVVSQEATDA